MTNTYPAVETKRCAVYTRTVTSQSFDQGPNSLDAQREACVGYIQRQPGWKLVDERYDDDGFSGASLERPALRRLLRDIDAGKIDVVVARDVDRLSRSGPDYVQIMDRFDKAGVAFVSVAQNCSTADLTGQLMLNMLMSFIGPEHEMIAERMRARIAAARRKAE